MTMEQAAHMRLSGHVEPFVLAPDAHRQLLRYLDDARAALGADPDGDEIVRDLEAGIGDRLLELAATSDGPVAAAQMTALLAEAGPVRAAQPASEPRTASARGRFWCRIVEGRWFGGICLGIAARGELRVDWVRTVVLLLTLFTGGLLGVVYLILLLVLPPVPSVEEYRRLRDAPREPAGRAGQV
jgi:phage shock protein PspC (stress-responsive transcriptional regulator)